MAKLTCFLVLLVAVILCAEAILIDPEPMPSSGSDNIPNLRERDRKCKTNGVYSTQTIAPCTSKCVNGIGQDVHCPESFKFDTFQHCTPDRRQTAEEGSSVHHYKLDVFKAEDMGWCDLVDNEFIDEDLDWYDLTN
ncbi:hypothetical protein CEXT_564911 [Caerostris extrusa]|uniref:Uncharacterized protein n=1 Tax=Caerostris extrusa TaxID=172846 RepID=A0AAV4Q9M8_CAEEX|nr:hypothetical protein CEXT_564911 [Caerostris extrusa]